MNTSQDKAKPVKEKKPFVERLLYFSIWFMSLVVVLLFGLDAFMLYEKPMSSLPKWITTTPIAHRGLHNSKFGIPENSIPAFQRAIDHGYAIELDVHLLADGQIVVYHDFDLKGLDGQVRKVKNCTSEELAMIRLREASCHIPSLDEVLELVAGRVPLLIEIKNKSRKDRSLERALGPMLEKYAGPFAVQSFNAFSLKWFRKHYPDIPRGQLACDFGYEDTDINQRWHKLFATRHLFVTYYSRPHFISYDHRCLPAWSVRKKKKAGLPVLGWTVRDEEQSAAASIYCDNIIFEDFLPD